jgi:hypothetical protein
MAEDENNLTFFIISEKNKFDKYGKSSENPAIASEEFPAALTND